MRTVGIRREDKDAWEARVPLVPEHVKGLVARGEATVKAQPSAQRVFTDDEFASVGAAVTEDLDEGPIIEQNVGRTDHADTVPALVAKGQELESRTLTEAVRLYAEHRVFLDDRRTVIFR